MTTRGSNVNELERLAAEVVGVKYAVALSCGLLRCIWLFGWKG
jgi:dTDP-4-amino-4,6-dideoxygalactose transaminase